MEQVYRCTELLDEYEQALNYCSKYDYQAYENRIEILEQLINSGVEFTTISQLSNIR